MKTFAITAIIATVVSLALAGPVAEANPDLERRATTNVLLCKNQNFGDCYTLSVQRGGPCYNFPGDFNDKVSSLRTGGPDVTCSFFTDGSCNGAAFVTRGPNPTIPGNFNDKLSSVRC